MNSKINQKKIINEEIRLLFEIYNTWDNDEPSIADKLYSKIGISPSEPKKINIDAELIGFVDKLWDKPIEPIPIYKNPKNLVGFNSNTRGILLNNGDLYLGQSPKALHENMLELLAKKNIIPFTSIKDYNYNYPNEFIAVVRIENTNNFGESTAYYFFPKHYLQIFNIANKKQPYIFKNWNDVL